MTDNTSGTSESKISHSSEHIIQPIASIFGLMLVMFALLQIILTPSPIQTIAPIAVGLVLTVILIYSGRMTFQGASIAWLGTSVFLGGIFLLISRPTTLVGSVIDAVGTPVAGLQLVFIGADGIEHKVVTDKSGNFEIINVPDGRYTVTTSNMLLFSGTVPAGIQRIISITNPIGSISYLPTGTPTPTPTMTLTPKPTLTPTLTPSPTLTSTPMPTQTPSVSELISHGKEQLAEDNNGTAIDTLSTAIAQDSASRDAYFYRGLAYLENKDYINAMTDLYDVLKLNPSDQEASANLSDACFMQGEIDYNNLDYANAIIDYACTIQYDPDNKNDYYENALLRVGAIAQITHDYESAILLYSNVIATANPLNVYIAFSERGYTYLAMGEIDLAQSDFSEAISHNPSYKEAYLGRGNTYLQYGDTTSAERDYNSTIRLSPNDPRGYFGLALVYDYLGDIKNAKLRCDDTENAADRSNTILTTFQENKCREIKEKLAYKLLTPVPSTT